MFIKEIFLLLLPVNCFHQELRTCSVDYFLGVELSVHAARSQNPIVLQNLATPNTLYKLLISRILHMNN